MSWFTLLISYVFANLGYADAQWDEKFIFAWTETEFASVFPTVEKSDREIDSFHKQIAIFTLLLIYCACLTGSPLQTPQNPCQTMPGQLWRKSVLVILPLRTILALFFIFYVFILPRYPHSPSLLHSLTQFLILNFCIPIWTQTHISRSFTQ